MASGCAMHAISVLTADSPLEHIITQEVFPGHWPISDHFNQNFGMVHSLCTHGQSNSWRIGKWLTISNFLFCTLSACPSIAGSTWIAWGNFYVETTLWPIRFSLLRKLHSKYETEIRNGSEKKLHWPSCTCASSLTQTQKFGRQISNYLTIKFGLRTMYTLCFVILQPM